MKGPPCRSLPTRPVQWPGGASFPFGLAGSAAVETLRVVIAYERGRIPARYKKWGFWAVRSLLGAFAGLLAVAYDVQSGILAMHIGAATPAIIENFATKPPLPAETGDATAGESS